MLTKHYYSLFEYILFGYEAKDVATDEVTIAGIVDSAL